MLFQNWKTCTTKPLSDIMTAFFLDSCIFFAYAYPHENWHDGCFAFLQGNYNRFSGQRVKSEIDIRLSKRKWIYSDLVNYLARGQTPEQFMSDKLTNSNDIRHIREILSEVGSQSLPDVLTYLRDKNAITRLGINEAFGRINHPLVDRANDETCVNLIEVLITNRSDAEILVDALYFSETHPLTFTTLDSTDITRNKNQIIRAIRRYKLLDVQEELPFEIKHLGEAV